MGAPYALLRIGHIRIMVSPAVNILVQGQHILRTGHHAKAATFASLLVDNYRSSYFCHIAFVFCESIIRLP
jgi:hypothetical protein